MLNSLLAVGVTDPRGLSIKEGTHCAAVTLKKRKTCFGHLQIEQSFSKNLIINRNTCNCSSFYILKNEKFYIMKNPVDYLATLHLKESEVMLSEHQLHEGWAWRHAVQLD